MQGNELMEWPRREAAFLEKTRPNESPVKPYRERVAGIAHLLMSDSCDATHVIQETFQNLSCNTQRQSEDSSRDPGFPHCRFDNPESTALVELARSISSSALKSRNEQRSSRSTGALLSFSQPPVDSCASRDRRPVLFRDFRGPGTSGRNSKIWADARPHPNAELCDAAASADGRCDQ